MACELAELEPVPECWKQRHMLGLEDLSAEEILLILDTADKFRKALDRGQHSFPCWPARLASIYSSRIPHGRGRVSGWRPAGWVPTSLIFGGHEQPLKGETVIDTARTSRPWESTP